MKNEVATVKNSLVKGSNETYTLDLETDNKSVHIKADNLKDFVNLCLKAFFNKE